MHDPPRDTRRDRFEELFRRHRDPLLAYLVRRMSSSEDAADLLADVFLVAWRRFDEMPGGDQARPWLYGVARRSLANYRRKESRRHALADRLRCELSQLDIPQVPADDSPAAIALSAMPERERELLRLMVWEGLDAAQMATVLNCSPNAVRIRLHRAKRRFSVLLSAPTRYQSSVILKEAMPHEDA